MTDDDELKQHWQSLAEQLGLDPGSEGHGSPSEPVSEKRVQDAPSPPPPREAMYSPRVEREEVIPFPEPKPAEDDYFARTEAQGEERPEPTADAPPLHEERGKPRERRESGRGRGRSSQGGSGRDRRSGPGPREGRSSRDDSRGGRGRGGRSGGGRGRGRGRDEDAPLPKPAPALGFEEEEIREDLPFEAVGEIPAPAPKVEEDDEELDTLSDWNVPSWAELIDSLYRPER